MYAGEIEDRDKVQDVLRRYRDKRSTFYMALMAFIIFLMVYKINFVSSLISIPLLLLFILWDDGERKRLAPLMGREFEASAYDRAKVFIFAVTAFLVWSRSTTMVREVAEDRGLSLETLQRIGLVGDSFGMMNSILNVAAVSGIAYTLLLQMRSNDMQREELMLQRLESEASRITQEETNRNKAAELEIAAISARLEVMQFMVTMSEKAIKEAANDPSFKTTMNSFVDTTSAIMSQQDRGLIEDLAALNFHLKNFAESRAAKPARAPSGRGDPADSPAAAPPPADPPS